VLFAVAELLVLIEGEADEGKWCGGKKEVERER